MDGRLASELPAPFHVGMFVELLSCGYPVILAQLQALDIPESSRTRGFALGLVVLTWLE